MMYMYIKTPIYKRNVVIVFHQRTHLGQVERGRSLSLTFNIVTPSHKIGLERGYKL